ncbi:MAG: tetratricopeptide repeat protein [Magnetococcales bacterium]|nr:tetratricopeptide repeat protein [Magnetococcales bacterium]
MSILLEALEKSEEERSKRESADQVDVTEAPSPFDDNAQSGPEATGSIGDLLFSEAHDAPPPSDEVPGTDFGALEDSSDTSTLTAASDGTTSDIFQGLDLALTPSDAGGLLSDSDRDLTGRESEAVSPALIFEENPALSLAPADSLLTEESSTEPYSEPPSELSESPSPAESESALEPDLEITEPEADPHLTAPSWDTFSDSETGTLDSPDSEAPVEAFPSFEPATSDEETESPFPTLDAEITSPDEESSTAFQVDTPQFEPFSPDPGPSTEAAEPDFSVTSDTTQPDSEMGDREAPSSSTLSEPNSDTRDTSSHQTDETIPDDQQGNTTEQIDSDDVVSPDLQTTASDLLTDLPDPTPQKTLRDYSGGFQAKAPTRWGRWLTASVVLAGLGGGGYYLMETPQGAKQRHAANQQVQSIASIQMPDLSGFFSFNGLAPETLALLPKELQFDFLKPPPRKRKPRKNREKTQAVKQLEPKTQTVETFYIDPTGSASTPVTAQASDSQEGMADNTLAASIPSAEISTAAPTLADGARMVVAGEEVPPPDEIGSVAIYDGYSRIVRHAPKADYFKILTEAHSAWTRGELTRANTLYDQVLAQKPNNRDALLGKAALAVHFGKYDIARAYYVGILDLIPGDHIALAGLASLPGESTNREVQIRHRLRGNPDSPHLNFILGSMLASRSQWHEAQQHFFKAYSGHPDQADYAFNLAVSLEQMDQITAAQHYYEIALEKAELLGSGFDTQALRTHLSILARPSGSDPSTHSGDGS